MRPIFIAILLSVLFISCDKRPETANQIIDHAIQYHGGEAYDTLDVAFKFRDKAYSIHLKDGLYKYTRISEDSLGQVIEDKLTNKGFERFISDKKTPLSKKDSAAYANSVNSVAYFALLPYGLQQEAVIAELISNQSIDGKKYRVVSVTFAQEQGGKDYDDEFYYWFDSEDYSMDYFAYKYHTDGGGLRFREAYNSRRVAGILFQDYKNYEVNINTPMLDLLALNLSNELKLLSKIELKFND